METYRYTLQDGWLAPPAGLLPLPALVTDSDTLSDWLFSLGYLRLAQSGPGRCGVGHFHLWHREGPPGAWPLFAIEIDQEGAESVVWIATLPALWEFLRRYGQIGVAMHWPLPGDEEEDADDEESCGNPTCPDCGEPTTWVPRSDNDDENNP